jgi:4-amino-4-deoxy-L-arabinose transferase-like glycosyltransferase
LKRWLTAHKDVLTIAAIACVLRISVIDVLHEQGYTSDEKEYISLANNLALGKPFVDTNGEWSTKAPLWPFVLSLVFRLFGQGLLMPHVFGCLLGALTVFLGFKLCLQITGHRFTALITAGLLALYPGLVVYSVVLQTESLYIVFVLLTFIVAERLRAQPTLRHGVLLGFFAAAAAMTRAVFFGFFIIMLLLLVWTYRDVIREYSSGITAAALVWILLLTPWTIRNYSIHGTFIPISSWGGISMLLGNNPYATGTWSTLPGFEQWMTTQAAGKGVDLTHSTEIQRSTLGRTLAVEFIMAEPTAAAKLWLKKFYMHWVYPIANSDSNTRLQAVCVAGDILLYTFAALQVVLHCEARYRLPIVPLIAMCTAAGLALLLDTRRRAEFFNIHRNRILAGSWLALVAGVYSFTAWLFLTGII